MLKLQFADGSRESIWLVDARFRIGKDSQNKLILDAPEIEAFHAELIQKDEELYLKNVNPEYSVVVNGKRVQKAVRLKAGDLFQIGPVSLRIIHPSQDLKKMEPTQEHEADGWGLATDASWAQKSLFPIGNNVIIGRDPECDICVPVNHLSRQHARLTPTGGFLLIKDLDSTNGTFLNGERITQGRAKPGDKVRFDVVNFTVVGPKEDANKTIVRQAPQATGSTAGAPKPAQPTAPRSNKPKVKAIRPKTEPSVSGGGRSTSPHLSHTVASAEAPNPGKPASYWVMIAVIVLGLVGTIAYFTLN